MGANSYSKEGKYKPIVSKSIRERAQLAKDMFNNEGRGVAEISDLLNISVSRVYEYLKIIKEEEDEK